SAGLAPAHDVAERGHTHLEADLMVFEVFGDLVRLEVRAFRDDAHRVAFAAHVCVFERLTDLFERGRALWDDDELRAAENAAHRRQIATVAPHDFEQEAALVAAGGVAQLVDRVEDGVERGIDADAHVRAPDVVVDAAGDADDRKAKLVQRLGAAQAAVTADHD